MDRLIALATLSLLSAVTTAAPKAPVYKDITMRDFQIDGPQLAAASAPVQITGGYTKPGNMDMLYANSSDAAVATYTNSAYAEQLPFIPLLTDNASHAIREAMYDCRSRNAVGCLLTLRGMVTMCSVTNGFGAQRDTPCLAVLDGFAYSPPRPALAPASAPAAVPASPIMRTQAAQAVDTTAEIQPGPAFERRVRTCVQTPKMADVANVYQKCVDLASRDPSAFSGSSAPPQ
jgi:hypothetical protein